MKKVLLAAMIVALAGTLFTSCSSDGGDDFTTTPKYKIHDGNIVGVWRDGSDCFISFSSDSYNSALLNNKFIDEGSYTIKGDTITVSNQYFGKKTKYVVEELTDRRITVTATYSDRWEGGEKTTKMQFAKAKDAPCQKSNELVGKSFMAQYSVSHGSQHWNKTFSSNNIINCVSTDAANRTPFTFYYVYLPPKIYFYVIRYNDFYYDTVRYDNVELDENNQIKYMSSLYGQKMY